MSGAGQEATGDGRVSDGLTPLAVLETALAAAHTVLHRAELAASDLGVPIAPLYLASARGSLRHASACVAQHGCRAWPGVDDREIVIGSGIRLEAVNGHPGLGQRRRDDGRDLDVDTGGEIAAWPRRPDLGADLVASPLAAALCEGPIGSTLLFCALAHHRWLHQASRTKWSTDVSGARALVSAINGGASCAMPVAGPLIGLVDAEVVAMLAMHGWTRIISPRIPGLSGPDLIPD